MHQTAEERTPFHQRIWFRRLSFFLFGVPQYLVGTILLIAFTRYASMERTQAYWLETWIVIILSFAPYWEFTWKDRQQSTNSASTFIRYILSRIPAFAVALVVFINSTSQSNAIANLFALIALAVVNFVISNKLVFVPWPWLDSTVNNLLQRLPNRD